jgi:hypothetical protein
MDVLNKIATYIQNLDRKQFQRLLLISLLATAMIIGMLTYFVQQQKSDLIAYITQLHTLTDKSFKIIAENKKMAKEEQRLKEILDKNKDFSMKGFFEQFCREQNIVPEQGWDARTESVNEKFDEMVLPATFKGLNTEKLTKIIEALDKKEIVYIKALTIRNDEEKKINAEITLATKKYKTLLE